ncbi:MAG: hypothetical protein GY754_05175 [bacterium]|nr:hypothetical protein [bacterium]
MQKTDPYNLLPNPLLLKISGKLGNIVYINRKGTNFYRKWVKPYDPKTYKQLKSRNNFARLITTWQQLNKGEKHSWDLHIKRNRYQMSGYNAFIGYNMKRLAAGKTIVLYRRKENTAFREYLTGKPQNREIDEFIYIYAEEIRKKPGFYSLVPSRPPPGTSL